MMDLQPKKSLGQHFLIDKNIAGKIVASFGIESTPHVIEIGPGTGILTRLLLKKKGIDLHCIEIDNRAVEMLRQAFPEIHGRIHKADILRFDPGEIIEKPFSVIGNFPYNISSQIFFRILDFRNSVSQVVCMIQKEVAERIVAAPGSKTYGILSVLLQAFFKIEYLFTVNPGVFYPPPNVVSSVIKLARNDIKELDCDESAFFTVVKAGFNQRRKMLRNSLKRIFINLEADHELLSRRPEQLSVEEFVLLTGLLARLNK